jgi:hypothetical protein
MPESDPVTVLRQFLQSRPALIKAAAQIVAANPGAVERILNQPLRRHGSPSVSTSPMTPHPRRPA